MKENAYKQRETRTEKIPIDLHTTNVLNGFLLIGMGYLLASSQLSLITVAATGSDRSLWVINLEERLRGVLGLR